MGVLRKQTPVKSEPLTEQSIQRRLNHVFASWKYNVDGLFVFEWESDKLIWTKTGYIYEFEIKISRADFKNDFKNKKEKHIILKGPTEEERFMPSFYQSYEWNKHLYNSIDDCKARIKPGDSHLIESHKKPNYFYYAVPEGLIQPEEVPEYAGLIYILKEYHYECQSYVIVKKAPCLHKQKYKDGELNLAEKFWWNWQSDRRLRQEAQRERDDARKALQEELAERQQEETYQSLKWKYKVASSERNEYQSLYSAKCRDQNIDRMIIRKLRHELLQLKPDFDYKALEAECEKIYGIK